MLMKKSYNAGTNTTNYTYEKTYQNKTYSVNYR